MKKLIIFLISVLFFIASILLYFYKDGSARDIVIIQEENTEFKRKPLDPGGITIPNSDSHIYDQLKRHSTKTSISDVKILPDPEEPISIHFNNKDNNIIPVSSIDDILNNIDYYEKEFLLESKEPEDENLVLPNAIDRYKKSASDNDDGELFLNDLTVSSNTSLNFIKASEDSHKRINKAGGDLIEGGGYFIQLAITRSEKEATKAWIQIEKRNFGVLSNVEPAFKKINKKNTSVFFLVLAGPYPNKYKAKMVCESLKSNKQNCIVMK